MNRDNQLQIEKIRKQKLIDDISFYEKEYIRLSNKKCLFKKFFLEKTYNHLYNLRKELRKTELTISGIELSKLFDNTIKLYEYFNNIHSKRFNKY